ncbi:MinD/ParA family ATP-binding protein [Microbispora hainanensis]|uniref:MinD/ParA family ATP-binding protein n=1 Tax=Microbispora hainanensis TaxID=568844 RepID=UPI003AF3E901
MPDEVEIAVSAVTSATLASPTPPPAAEPEPASPYPADPWSLVPAEPASGGLLRGAADSAAGSGYGAPAQEDVQTSESSSTGPVRDPLFDPDYSDRFGYESGKKSEFGVGYGSETSFRDLGFGEPGFGEPGFGDSGFGDTARFGDTKFGDAGLRDPGVGTPGFGDAGFGDAGFGDAGFRDPGFRDPGFGETTNLSDTTAFVTRPASSAASPTSSPADTRESAPAESSTAFGTPPGTRAEESATSTGPVKAPSFGSGAAGFGAASDSEQVPDRSAESSSPRSSDASPGSESESSEEISNETPGDDQPQAEDDGHSQPGGASSFTTPLFSGSFPGSPADTDAYKNLGAFTGGESVSGTSSTKEPLRGWLEPAVPVPAAQQDPAVSDEPEEPPAPPEIPSPFGPPRAEAVPDFADDRFTGSLREELAAEERKPYEPGPVAAAAPPPPPAPAPVPTPSPQPAPAPQPAPERASAPVETPPVERDAVAEREAYQAPRRPAPVSAFSSPARTTGKSAGSKPTADSLDPVTLLRGRRNAPATGWRRLVYKASAGLIKPGEAPEVRRRRELVQRARTPVATGHHRVAVLSLKGGVGKTTTTVGLGATLAQVRGDRVIAVDANPDRGTLSDKVELETAATVRDLLNERAQIKRYVDIRAFTSQTPSRLEILASDRDPSVSEAFSAKDYHAVANVLENFYSICITDCGTGLLHSAMSGVLGMADQIVLVSSPSVDGARAASATLDWLEAHHYGDLVRAATVVLCSVRPRSKSTVDLDKLEAHFAARCRTVVRVPYDAHLEEGAEIDLDRLQEATRDAYLRLAASVGDGFAGPHALAAPRFSEIPDHL